MLDDDILRLTFFLGVLVSMICLESIFPKKRRQQGRRSRWSCNVGLALVSVALLRIFGASGFAIGLAHYTMYEGWGLLAKLPLPLFLDLVLGLVLLDMAIYFQHVLSHRLPLLWRFHKVHHSDRDVDVTTAIRFHPIEIVLSLAYKCCAILLLGPLVYSVIVFEIILNASAMFNHSNIRLSKPLDTIIRWFFVTPDMHRVHHSVVVTETNSNYGFCLSVWDRLFNTYIDQPVAGHIHMKIGLSSFQTDEPASLRFMLTLPFTSAKSKRD